MFTYRLTYMVEKVPTISFREIPIPIKGNQARYFRVFYAYNDGRSHVRESFMQMPEEYKKNVRNCIIRMATNKPYYKSDRINWELSGAEFGYGEISFHPHRFFFFRSDNSLVFFGYILKKVNKLSNSTYKYFQDKKVIYEREFSRQFK